MKTNYAKHTLAELKREAKSGTLKLELVEWNGKTGEDIPERLRGIRQVKGRSNSLVLANANGEESYLWFTCANLVDYDGQTLTIYNWGIRELTEEEKTELEKAEAEKEEQKKSDPWWLDNLYWHMKSWWKKSPCPWLFGAERIKGKKLVNTRDGQKVEDFSTRGEKILVYKVHHVINLCA